MNRRTYCMLAAVPMLAGYIYSQEAAYVSAKKLFYAEPVKDKTIAKSAAVKGKSGAAGQHIPVAYTIPGLHYTVFQEVAPGREQAVDPGREFHSGDRVRFEFEANFDGYLYVTQAGSSGAWTVLFPDARINGGRNQITKRMPYAVPAQPKYFVFNDVPGTEKVMVFLCKTPVNGLPSRAEPGARTVDQGIINELNSSLTPRDLVFEKDEAAPQSGVGVIPTASTYVVNPNQNGQAVVVTINLKHAR